MSDANDDRPGLAALTQYDKWHLDEVFVKINGTTHYLWRAVDPHGNVLDVLVRPR